MLQNTVKIPERSVMKFHGCSVTSVTNRRRSKKSIQPDWPDFHHSLWLTSGFLHVKLQMSNYTHVSQGDSESIHTDLEDVPEVRSGIDERQTSCQCCELQRNRLKKRSLVIYILFALFLFLLISFLYVQLREPTKLEIRHKGTRYHSFPSSIKVWVLI